MAKAETEKRVSNGNNNQIERQYNQAGADDVPDREVWASPVEFVLSCLGYAVGLGNIWRFPWLCYTNGGGAFLIPYFIMLAVVGVPVFFQELIIGQYSGMGPLHIWSMCPIFQGAGLGMIFITSMFIIFYCMILGYAIFFLAVSFQSVLPWSHCTHDYNTAYCYAKSEARDCEEANTTLGIWFNQTCFNSSYLEQYDELVPGCVGPAENCTVNIRKEELMNLSKQVVSASEEYLNFGVLQVSESIEETGGMVWELAAVLGAGWLLCAICLIKGIRSAGKVVYFTALFPYVVLFILMIRGATLPGSLEGVKFYITPQWDKLTEAKVWADAAGQIFFSLSVGGGGLMTFASYNKFHNNIYRDTLIVAVGNCVTSVFAGFVIFSILGFMSHELNKPVPEVVAEGSTLAFVAYPTVVAELPISQLWSVLFFLMLITLGLDSLFAGTEAVITAIMDGFPKLRSKKWLVVIGLCTLFWVLGLTMCTRAGPYWLDVIAYYSSGWALIVMAFVEMLVFNWFYGAHNIKKNVEEMIGFKLWNHWLVVWSLAPAVLLTILVVNLVDFTPLKYGDAEMPIWATVIGWLIAVTAIFCILVGAIVVTVRLFRRGDFKGKSSGEILKALFKPNAMWMPSYVRDPKKGAAADRERQLSLGSTAGKGKSDLAPPPYSLEKDMNGSAQNGSASYDNPAFQGNNTML